MKKYVGILVIFILIGLGIIVYRYNNQKMLINPFSVPDKILIYKDSKIIELGQEDKEFEEVYRLNKIKYNGELTETAIDFDAIEEIKEGLAIEYLYNNLRSIETNQINREFSKVLFVYSGWCEEHIIFYNNGIYESGTIKNRYNSSMIKKLIQEIEYN